MVTDAPESFDSLSAQDRLALLMALLGRASGRPVQSLEEFAKEEGARVEDLWRGFCEQAKVPFCTIPKNLLAATDGHRRLREIRRSDRAVVDCSRDFED